MKISVEDWHIRTGIKEDCLHCPIANAITPRLPAGQHADVGAADIYVRDTMGHIVLDVPTPKAAVEFIRKFDLGMKVEPFEFDVDLS